VLSTTVDYRSLSDIVCSVNRLQRLSLYIPGLIYVYSSRLLGSLQLIFYTIRALLISLLNSDSTWISFNEVSSVSSYRYPYKTVNGCPYLLG